MTEQLTVDQAAALAGVRPSTWRAYVARGQAPEPDGTLGRTPWWRPETVRAWMDRRPGSGRWAASRD